MKVLVCDKLDDNAVNKMKNAGLDVTVKTGMSPDELKGFIKDYDVMVVRSATRATKDIIDAGENLKLIIRAGVGLDNVDQVAAKEKCVDVRNTPGVTSISVAEHTFGLMLALARHLPQAGASIRAGKWEKKKFAGTELFEKTLGLIGLGRIGQEVAARAKAFGMKVVAFDPLLDKSVADSLGIPLMSLDELYKISDYISLHVPLIPDTKHMINKETISKMKKGVRIVNCSRGGTVDEQALANAIKEGYVAGAAFDVFEKEPIEETNPLIGLDAFIGAPHLGAAAAEGQARAGDGVANIAIEFSRR